MRNLRAASVQFESAAGNPAANREKIRQFVEAAAQKQVEIIAFPECCITGYWFLRKLSREDLCALAEPIGEGVSSQFLLNLAVRYHMTIGAGLIEITEERKLYNTYVVALSNGEYRRHRKLHAFVNPFLSCGSTYTVFDVPGDCRIGVLICYDNNIIENARITALEGADILLAPHQTGGCKSRSPHAMGLIDPQLWERRESDPQAIAAEFRGPKGREWLMRWLPARAHDNGLFVLFSNGVGRDDDEIRTGNAMILDPYGRIITETGKADDDMVIADLDASLLDECTGRRWLRARRPELYNPITVPLGIEEDTRFVRLGREPSAIEDGL